MSKEIKVNKRIDLRGEVCPYPLVKSKLAMEDIGIGHVLEILVDHLPSVENIPRGMENEGQDILEVGKVSETDWRIVVRKKKE